MLCKYNFIDKVVLYLSLHTVHSTTNEIYIELTKTHSTPVKYIQLTLGIL